MFAARVPETIAFLSEAIFVLFDILSAVLICTVFYFAFVGGAIKLRRQKNARSKRLIICSMPLVAAVLLAGVNALAIHGFLLGSGVAFVVAIAAFATFYFVAFRWMINDGDFRIQYTMILWAALSAVALIAITFLYYASDHVRIEKNFTISYDMLIQAASIIVSAFGIAFTFVMKTEQSQRDARQQLYQTLELQSIDLFRFEALRPDLVAALWYGNKPETPAGGAQAFDYVTRQYVCQMLNLFEMAVRFRAQGILPAEVFGSWVVWIWELCSCARFQTYWSDRVQDLPSNYTRDLREIVNSGVETALRTDLDPEKARKRFFEDVADEIDCDEIGEWFKARPEKRLFRLAQKAAAAG